MMLFVDRRFAALLVGVSSLAATRPGSAQGLNGFLSEPGRATIAVSQTLESYDEFWVGSQTTSDASLGTIETGTASLWFDVGLAPGLALTGSLAYVDAISDGPAPLAQQGLQDRSFLLRYRFLTLQASGIRHRFVAAAGLRGPASAYDPNRVVAIGDGTVDSLFRVVYQLESDLLDGVYGAAEFGYDVRGEEAPDGTSLHGEVGATLARVSASVSATQLWADGGFDIGDPGFSFQGLRGESLRLGAKLFVRATDVVGFAVSGFITPDGRNVGEATGTSGSLVFRM